MFPFSHSVDYRCQVIHECVTCKTPVACYTVATTCIEFVLILIVPSTLIEPHRSFKSLVRTNYMNWLFKPGTNDFDRTLQRMLRYKTNEMKWG
jgi:hypothetical protein